MKTRTRPSVGRMLNEAKLSLAPRGGSDALRQTLIMLACYAAYDISRALCQGREAIALANGVYLMNLEKAMGIWWEPWIQGRVSAVDPLITVMVWTYMNLHLPLMIGTLVWLYTQRRPAWGICRNCFVMMNFIAVVVFALLPTAPPRMIFTSGVADINFIHGARAHIFENGLIANPFAAMPSLHFAYALFIALTLLMYARSRWASVAGFAYASLVLVAIVATGNHFVLDAVAGGLVVVAAWAFAAGVQPSRATQASPVAVRDRDG